MMRASENAKASRLPLFSIVAAIVCLAIALILQAFYITSLEKQNKQRDEGIRYLQKAVEKLLVAAAKDGEVKPGQDGADESLQPRFVVRQNHVDDDGPSGKRNEDIKFHNDEHNTENREKDIRYSNVKDNGAFSRTTRGDDNINDDRTEHLIERRDLGQMSKEQKRQARLRKCQRRFGCMTGPKGEPGIKGDRGPRGPSGKMGPRGLKGEPGQTSTVNRKQATEIVHLVGNGRPYDMTKEKRQDDAVFKRWRIDSLVGKLTYEHGRGKINIAVSGYYYVYCQIHYDGRLVYNQHLVRKNKQKIMMFGFDTFNGTASGPKRHSSTKYIGGVFKLLKGDSIFVAGVRTRYYFSPKSSYYGLFLVNEFKYRSGLQFQLGHIRYKGKSTMQKSIAICCLILLGFASSVSTSPAPARSNLLPFTQKYFIQHVDHFNYAHDHGYSATYYQRYLVQDKFWARSQGPIFFYSGNEGPITAFWNASGFVHELAAKHRALIIFAEHRYYGASLPFGMLSFTKENIAYLTIEQALADYAVLLKSLKTQYKAENCKVVTFGGSYGGMLSGYLRYKYPHIVDAAVASSAPFYTIAGNRPRSEFFQAVTSTCRLADPTCPTNVQAGFSKLKDLFAQGDSGMKKIQQLFNLCSSKILLDTEKHVYLWIRNAFTMMAMADYPYPASFLGPEPLPANPVNVACKYLADAEDKLVGLAQATTMIYGPKAKCHDIYKEFVACADPTGCGLGNDALAWDYQVLQHLILEKFVQGRVYICEKLVWVKACTEMMLPGGSTNVTDMFPPLDWTLPMRDTYCTLTWNLGKPRYDWIATQFWGTAKDIKHASNIVFPNGNLDPWMPGGVLENLSPTLRAVMVIGGAHHLDLRASNPADPKTVVEARETIELLLKEWLSL
eukprot:gene10639-11767_t